MNDKIPYHDDSNWQKPAPLNTDFWTTQVHSTNHFYQSIKKRQVKRQVKRVNSIKNDFDSRATL